MSRNATCPKCAGRITVPSGFAGEQIFCPECGAGFRVRRPAGQRPATPPAPTHRTEEAPPAPESQPAIPAYTCGMCGGSFAPEQVYDVNGIALCHDCYARSAVPTPGPVPEPVWVGPPDANVAPLPFQAPRRSPPGYLPWLVAGGIALLVVGVGAAVIGFRSRGGSAPSPPTVAATKQPTQAESSDGSRVKLRDFSTLSPSSPEKPSVGRQINAAWREAKAPADRGDFASADAKHKDVFALLESQAGQPQYRSFANDLVSARREWDAVRGHLGTVAAPSNPPTVNPGADPNPPVKPAAPAAVASSSGGNNPPPPPPSPTTQTTRKTSPRKALDEAKMLELLTAADRAAKAGQKFNAAVLYKRAYDLIGAASEEPRSDALQQALARAVTTRKGLLAEVKELPETRDLALAALLTRGNAALATENWQAGLEALHDARQMVEEQTKVAERPRNERYLEALHGMAVAYLRLNDVPKAGELFDDRSPLGRMVKEKLDGRQQAGRDLVYNRAVVDMIQKYNVMRGVCGVKDYLAAQDATKPPDEEMVDLLGTAIHLAYESGRVNEGNKLMKEAEALYAEQVKRLEATRPGQRRWGAEWRPAGEVAQLVAEKQRALATLQTVSRDLDAAQKQLAAAKKGRLQPQGMGLSFFVVNPAEVQAAEGAVAAAKERVSIAKAAVPPEPWKPRPEPTLPAAAYALAHPAPPAPEAVAMAPGSGSGRSSVGGGVVPGVNAGMPPTPVIPETSPPSPGTTEVAVNAPASPPPPRVQRNAVAFAVDRTHLVTAADVVGDANAVRLEDADGGSFPARVVTKQGALALLEVNAKDAGGAGLPYLVLAADFKGGSVRCAAIPSVSLFAPSVALLPGTSPAPSAQPGGAWQVNLERHPRLPGAPLLDGAGKVVGLVTARRDSPQTQIPAVPLAELRAFLQGANALPHAPGNGDPSRVYHVVVEQ